ncbi:MAG: hypothetical protein ACRC0V_11545 [Fusobacteriaceae bacterium]
MEVKKVQVYNKLEACYIIQENRPWLDIERIRNSFLSLEIALDKDYNSKKLIKDMKLARKENSILTREEWDLLRTIENYDDSIIFIGKREDKDIINFLGITEEQFKVLKKFKEKRNKIEPIG